MWPLIHTYIAVPLIQLVPWLLGFSAAFGALGWLMPCNKEHRPLHRGLLTDLCYCLFFACASRLVRIALISAGLFLLFAPAHAPAGAFGSYLQRGYGPMSPLPAWMQALIVLLASDFILYWAHRGFHRRVLWPFHAIHHAPEQVEWLTAYRFHPVNAWATFTLLDAATVLAGFSPEAIGMLAVFNGIYSPLVHANLNWTFGPLKYVLASPVFHRWHHTAQKEGWNKNYAPTFPLLDVAFGTFYMPEGRMPERYGIPGGSVPHGMLGQMLWPFGQSKLVLAKKRKLDRLV